MTGPRQGQQVYLMLSVTELPLAVRVAEVGEEGVLVLALPAAGKTPPAGAASLEFTTGQGVCRLDGSLERTRADGSARFCQLGPIRLHQRREHVRVNASVPVGYRIGGAEVEAHTTDVSGGGFTLARPHALKLGEGIHFSLHLPGYDEPLEAYGRSVRAAAEGGAGVKLERIAPADRERLIHWVFGRQREMLKLLRGA